MAKPTRDDEMEVLCQGELQWRPVSHWAYFNGYTNLAFPVLHRGEHCHWQAGSRTPEILGACATPPGSSGLRGALGSLGVPHA